MAINSMSTLISGMLAGQHDRLAQYGSSKQWCSLSQVGIGQLKKYVCGSQCGRAEHCLLNAPGRQYLKQ